MDARTIIGLNVEERVIQHIRTCRTANEMLDRLETLYGSKAQTSKDGLRSLFFNYQYDESQTVASNCIKIDGLAQELIAAGEVISNEWIITRILQSLPAKFKHFHAAWDSTAADEKTITNLIDRMKKNLRKIQKLRMDY